MLFGVKDRKVRANQLIRLLSIDDGASVAIGILAVFVRESVDLPPPFEFDDVSSSCRGGMSLSSLSPVTNLPSVRET